MFFNSFNFLIIYPLLFLLYYAIPAKWNSWRNVYLLVVSYLLYMNFKPAYALILLGVTVITFFAARAVDGSPAEDGIGQRKRKKKILVAGVMLTLLPLLVFKYWNFINDSLADGLDAIGLGFGLPGLNWAIPVGISFFTLQALSYLWDVWYGKMRAERNFLDYALYVSFFPSIVSGPINKASLILPQIKERRIHFDYGKVVEGLRMLLWGMFMKVVVADRAGLYVDTVLLHYQGFSGLSVFVASLLYSIQIYADFAGYSLMAIGVGKTLGFDLAENFNRPYFAFSVTDFWHRWHISLSTWLKDYIYIPLGGSRCSKLRNYWNIIVTFLVSGIWHGANWTFIVWGLLHGVFQVIEKAIGQQKNKYGRLGTAVKICITFLLVNFAWIFFRMPTLEAACGAIGKIFNPAGWASLYIPMETNTLFIIMGVIILLINDIVEEFSHGRLKLMRSKHTAVRWVTYISVTAIMLLTGVFDAGQFIYANF